MPRLVGLERIVMTGDPVQDKNIANQEITAYDAMHRWRKMPEIRKFFPLLGAENFPFPIPLKKNPAGQCILM